MSLLMKALTRADKHQQPGDTASASFSPAATDQQAATLLFQAKGAKNRSLLPWVAAGALIILLLWGGYVYMMVKAPPPVSVPASPPPAVARLAPLAPPADENAADTGGPQAATPAPEPQPATSAVAPAPPSPPPVPSDTHESAVQPDMPAPRQIPRTDAATGSDSGISIARGKQPPVVAPDLMQAYQALKEGRLDQARAGYEKYLAGQPDSVDALLGLGAVAAEQGNTAESARHYMRVLSLAPRNSVAQAALIGLVGRADPAEGETRLKQLLAEQPAPFLYYALGNLYAGTSRWDLAEKAYFQAYQGDPANADYAYNLAVSLEHIGQPKPALTYYRLALDLGQRSGSVHFDRALVAGRIAALAPGSGTR